MEIINRILNLIKQRGITPHKLEVEAGLSISSIQAWKNRKAKPSVEAIIKISKYFNVSTDYLLTGENTMDNNKKILDNSIKQTGNNNNAFMRDQSFQFNTQNKETVEKKENLNKKYSYGFYNRVCLLCKYNGFDIKELESDTIIGCNKYNELLETKNGEVPSFDLLKALSIKFNVSINFLLFGDISNNFIYSKKIVELFHNFEIPIPFFASYSGIPLNILDCIANGVRPIGTIDWRIKNTLSNLFNNDGKIEDDWKNYEYFIIEKRDLENHLELLEVSQIPPNENTTTN